MRPYYSLNKTVLSRGCETQWSWKRQLNLRFETINLKLNPGAFDEG
jgi:hypothetical protein